MTQVDKYNTIKIKRFFAYKKLSQAFLLFSVLLVIVSLFMILYIPLYPLSPITLGIYRPGYWMKIYNMIYNSLFSMIMSGLVGIVIFSPILMIFSLKLKSLHVGHKKQDVGSYRELKLIKKAFAEKINTSKIYYF